MEKQRFETTDLAFAAFLMLKGIELVETEREKGKTKFIFDDSVDLCEHLMLVYANSEFQKFDAHIRALKKLIHK